jgi:hypothetical protein
MELVTAFSVFLGACGGEGGVRVMFGIPVLIGITTSSVAIRTMAKIEQWYTHT